MQTIEEAKELDSKLSNILHDLHITHTVLSKDGAIDYIVNDVLNILKNEN